VRQLLIEFVLAVGFTGTTGFLFRERFERNYFLSTIVAFILFGSTFFTIKEFTKLWFEFTNRDGQITSSSYSIPNPTLAADEIFWLSIKDSKASGLFEEFIKKFPASPHLVEARNRLRELERDQIDAGRGAVSINRVQSKSSGLCATFNGRQICE
jgi:hypothetical protein